MNLPVPPERTLPDQLGRWQAVRVTDLPIDLPGYAHVYSGKVRDLYAPVDPAAGCRARPAAARRLGPHLGLRLRARHPRSPTRARC